jgi:hypothetical protein
MTEERRRAGELLRFPYSSCCAAVVVQRVTTDIIISRQRSGTVKATFAEHARRNGAEAPPVPRDIDINGAESESIYCEMCESREHDTVDCGNVADASKVAPAVLEHTYSPGKENDNGHSASKADLHKPNGAAAEKKDEDKWCALCEKDGHLAFDCPEEQY